MTKAEFARHLGIDRSTVTRWGQAGRLVIAPNGKVKVPESIEKINASQGHRADVSARHDNNRGSLLKDALKGPKSQNQQSTPMAIDEEQSDMEATPETIGEDRAHFKALKMHYENNILKIKEGLNTGDLVEKSDLNTELNQKARLIKNGLETLIDNLAPQLANTSDMGKKEKLIQSELDKLKEAIH